jgi:hypothetical protein
MNPPNPLPSKKMAGKYQGGANSIKRKTQQGTEQISKKIVLPIFLNRIGFVPLDRGGRSTLFGETGDLSRGESPFAPYTARDFSELSPSHCFTRLGMQR